MKKKQTSDKRRTAAKSVLRRDALKGLGALAVTAPAFGAFGCGSDAEGMTNPIGNSGPGAGAPGGSGAAGTVPAAAGTTSTPIGAAGMSSGSAGSTPRGTSPAGAGGSTEGTGTRGAAGATQGPAAGGGASGTSGRSAVAGAGGQSAGTAGQSPGTGGAAGSGSAGLVPVTFGDATTCTLTPTDPAGEGPFFIHEDEVMNDPGLMRSDMRDGRLGIELQLNLRVLDSESMCKPIAGVQVYVWHTDALGLYSGFANQNPDQTYTGGFERTVENMDRFCRGVQVTDAEGIVRFRTIYPGWYNGRAIHIHFVALRPGSSAETSSYRSAKFMVFTTQMYFAEQFSRMIHESNAPYNTRLSGGYNTYVKPQNTVVMPTARMEGSVAVGTLNVMTAASGSRR